MTNPIAAEVLAEAIPFNFDGLELSVKPSSEWSIRSLDRLERGYVTTWLELVLAGDSYATVIDADLKPEAVSRLIQVAQKTAGVAGN
ncbi:tail assembly chaperone [Microbacterium phage phiMiGM15]